MNLVRLAVALACVCFATRAQVPQGWAVQSRIAVPALRSTPSGITLFSPWHGTSRCTPTKPFTSITNLPAVLTSSGANAILVRDSDGSIVVANLQQRGGTVAIWHLRLAGSRVVFARMFSLGNARSFGSVDQLSWLPSGEVLFAHRHVPGAGQTRLPAQGLGILNLNTGRIRSIPIRTFPAGTINAAVAHPNGRTAYFATFGTNGHAVWHVPITTTKSVTATQLGPNLPSGVYQLQVDRSGTVWAGTWVAGLLSYSATPNAWVTRNRITQINALALDPASDEFVMASVTNRATTVHRWSAGTGTRNVPGAPRDLASGLAIRSSLLPFGQQGGGSAAITWQTRGNPGGAPWAGNARFSLTQKTVANPAASLIAYSTGLAAKPLPIVGAATLLLDPARILFVAPMARAVGQRSARLPIPGNPTLCGLQLFSQAFHVERGAFVSTRALSLRIL